MCVENRKQILSIKYKTDGAPHISLEHWGQHLNKSFGLICLGIPQITSLPSESQIGSISKRDNSSSSY